MAEERHRYVISDQPAGDCPRLMLIFRNHLSQQAHQNVREALADVLGSKRSIVFDAGVEEVYQLINGRWIRLDGSLELEDAPVPADVKPVRFREFT